MSNIRIPFNEPVMIEGVREALLEAIEGGHTAAGGPFTARCEALLAEEMGCPVLLTTSCTHALEMASLLLDIGPGDEVCVPSFAFVSTANAFALRGASLRFVDCDEFGNIDLDHLERLIGPKAKAVVPIHYGGNSCDMDRLLGLCERHDAALIEDAAQSIGARYKGRPLGAIGRLGCLSFHETKNVGAGEGGALVLGDETLRDRAHHLRDKGTNRREFRLGQADKYTWVDLGSSWGLSDLNAAYLWVQLQRRGEIHERRRILWERYRRELSEAAQTAGASIVGAPSHNEPNHHLFAILWPDAQTRDRFIAHMQERGILAPFHYVALHRSPFGRRYGQAEEALPGTERFSTRLTRLPLFYNLSDEDQGRVIEAVAEFCAPAS